MRQAYFKRGYRPYKTEKWRIGKPRQMTQRELIQNSFGKNGSEESGNERKKIIEELGFYRYPLSPTNEIEYKN